MVIEIGGIPIQLRTSDSGFREMLAGRYAGFLNPGAEPAFTFDVDLVTPAGPASDEDVRVTQQDGVWRIRRGDFLAEADLETRRGWIRQSVNPYSADALLRILHTLVLAPQGGFLLHASSAVRRGRAFLFSGVSGVGKTTLSRLAPPGCHAAHRRDLVCAA